MTGPTHVDFHENYNKKWGYFLCDLYVIDLSFTLCDCFIIIFFSNSNNRAARQAPLCGAPYCVGWDEEYQVPIPLLHEQHDEGSHVEDITGIYINSYVPGKIAETSSLSFE